MLPLHLLWTIGEATPSQRRLLFARAKPTPVPKVENKEDPTGPETEQDKPTEEPKDDREKLKDLSAKDATETVKKIAKGEQEKVEGYTESLNEAAKQLGEAFPATLDASEWAEAGRILDELPAVTELNKLTKFVNTKAEEYRQQVDGLDTKPIDTTPTLAKHGIEQKGKHVFDLRFPKGKAKIQYTLPGKDPTDLVLDESKDTKKDYIISTEHGDIGTLSVGDSKDDDVYTFTVNEKFDGQLSATINGSTETFWEGKDSSISTVSKEEQQELTSTSEEWNNNIQETRSYADSLINTLQGDNDTETVAALTKGQELVTLIGQNFDKLDATGLGAKEIAKHREAFNEIITDLQSAIDQTTENITSGTETDIAAFEGQWEQWLGEDADISADDAGNMRGVADDLKNYAAELKGNTALPEEYRTEKAALLESKAAALESNADTVLLRKQRDTLSSQALQWKNEITFGILNDDTSSIKEVQSKLQTMEEIQKEIQRMKGNTGTIGDGEEYADPTPIAHSSPEGQYSTLQNLCSNAESLAAPIQALNAAYPDGVPRTFTTESISDSAKALKLLEGRSLISSAIDSLQSLQDAYVSNSEDAEAYSEIEGKKTDYQISIDALDNFQARAVEQVGITEENLDAIASRCADRGEEYPGDLEADTIALTEAIDVITQLQSSAPDSTKALLTSKLNRIQYHLIDLKIAAEVKYKELPKFSERPDENEYKQALTTLEGEQPTIEGIIKAFNENGKDYRTTPYYSADRNPTFDLRIINNAKVAAEKLASMSVKKEDADGYQKLRSDIIQLDRDLDTCLEGMNAAYDEDEANHEYAQLGMHDYEIAAIDERADSAYETGEYPGDAIADLSRAADARNEVMGELSGSYDLEIYPYLEGKEEKLKSVVTKLVDIRDRMYNLEAANDDDMGDLREQLGELADKDVTEANIGDMQQKISEISTALADEDADSPLAANLRKQRDTLQGKVDAFKLKANEDFNKTATELESAALQAMENFRSAVESGDINGALYDFGPSAKFAIEDFLAHVEPADRTDYIPYDDWDDSENQARGWKEEIDASMEETENNSENINDLANSLQALGAEHPGFAVSGHDIGNTVEASFYGKELATLTYKNGEWFIPDYPDSMDAEGYVSDRLEQAQEDMKVDLEQAMNNPNEGVVAVSGVQSIHTESYHTVWVNNDHAGHLYDLFDGPNDNPLQNVDWLKDQVDTDVKLGKQENVKSEVESVVSGIENTIEGAVVTVTDSRVQIDNADGFNLATLDFSPNIHAPESYTVTYSVEGTQSVEDGKFDEGMSVADLAKAVAGDLRADSPVMAGDTLTTNINDLRMNAGALKGMEGIDDVTSFYLDQQPDGTTDGMMTVVYKGEVTTFNLALTEGNWTVTAPNRSEFTCTADTLATSIHENLQTTEATEQKREQLIADIQKGLPEGYKAKGRGGQVFIIHNGTVLLRISSEGELHDATTINVECATSYTQQLNVYLLNHRSITDIVQSIDLKKEKKISPEISKDLQRAEKTVASIKTELQSISIGGKNIIVEPKAIISKRFSSDSASATVDLEHNGEDYYLDIDFNADGTPISASLSQGFLLMNDSHMDEDIVLDEGSVADGVRTILQAKEDATEEGRLRKLVEQTKANIPNNLPEGYTVSVAANGGVEITYASEDGDTASVSIDPKADKTPITGDEIWKEVFKMQTEIAATKSREEEEDNESPKDKEFSAVLNALKSIEGTSVATIDNAITISAPKGGGRITYTQNEDGSWTASETSVYIDGTVDTNDRELSAADGENIADTIANDARENLASKSNEQKEVSEGPAFNLEALNEVVGALQLAPGHTASVVQEAFTSDGSPYFVLTIKNASGENVLVCNLMDGKSGTIHYQEVKGADYRGDLLGRMSNNKRSVVTFLQRRIDNSGLSEHSDAREQQRKQEFNDVLARLQNIEGYTVTTDGNTIDITDNNDSERMYRYTQLGVGEWNSYETHEIIRGGGRSSHRSLITGSTADKIADGIIKSIPENNRDTRRPPREHNRDKRRRNRPPEDEGGDEKRKRGRKDKKKDKAPRKREKESDRERDRRPEKKKSEEKHNAPPTSPREESEGASDYPNLDKGMVDAIRKRNRGEPYAEDILTMINEPPPMSKSDQKLVLNIIKNYSPEEQKVWAGLQEKCIALGKQLSPEDLKLYTGAFSKRDPSLLQQISPEGQRAIALAESGFTVEEVALLKKMNQQYLDRSVSGGNPEDLGSGGALFGGGEKEKGDKESRESDEDSPEKEKRFSKVLDDLKKEDFDTDAVRTKYQDKIDDIQAKIDADPPPKKAKLKKLRKLKQKWNKKLKTLGKLEKKMKPLLNVLGKVDSNLGKKIKKLAISADGITLKKEKGGNAPRSVMKALYKKGKIDQMQGETLSFKKFAKLITKRNPDISIDEEDTDSLDSDDESAPDSGEKLTGIERRLIALKNTQEWLQSKGLIASPIEGDNHINIANNIIRALESSAAEDTLGIYIDDGQLYMDDGTFSDTSIHNNFAGILKAGPGIMAGTLRSKIGKSGYEKIDRSLRELADAIDVPA